jgi:hypothetical protein
MLHVSSGRYCNHYFVSNRLLALEKKKYKGLQSPILLITVETTVVRSYILIAHKKTNLMTFETLWQSSSQWNVLSIVLCSSYIYIHIVLEYNLWCAKNCIAYIPSVNIPVIISNIKNIIYQSQNIHIWKFKRSILFTLIISSNSYTPNFCLNLYFYIPSDLLILKQGRGKIHQKYYFITWK